jgi:CDP-diglyceride synthetase
MTPSSTPIVGVVGRTVNDLLRAAVVLVCAASAGVHAALVPEHLHEGGPLLGGAFALSALALALSALLARLPEYDPWAVELALVVLAANVLAYVLSRTTGLPVLIPDPEEVDLLGVVTTVAEAVGVVVGVALLTRKELP